MVDIVDSSTMQWHQPKSGHREDGVEFKNLFTGEEGQPNNYWFTLVQVRDRYHTPPHRHMFDQVRYMIRGGFNFGPQEQSEGSVGYFTEGTTYEQRCDNYSFHLLLQCEGGSRSKYFSGKSMQGATDTLKETGEFINGRYRYADGREVDGYEAVYHQLTGEFPRYINPRYERPIIIEPSSFDWTADSSGAGASWKLLGVFNERELGLRMLRLEADGNISLRGDGCGLLCYAVKGSGDAGDQAWEAGAGLRIAANETVTLAAKEVSEIFVIKLPTP